MKKISIVLIVMFAVGCGTGNALAGKRGPGRGHGGMNPSNVVAQYPYQALNEIEKTGLLQMREEEKLARDVYLTLFKKWKHQVFNNIANSEQRHMDAVKSLLDKYGLKDPVADNNIGAFTNPQMKKLYNTLTQKGSASLVNALLVGATIEDLDIYDLKTLLAQTDNKDIQVIYRNLMKGSRNHLRAFTRALKAYGKAYTAKYLPQKEIDQIISGSWE